MKNVQGREAQQLKAPAPQNNGQKPENKDNLDSRGDLEFTNAPTGHNKKEVRDGEKNEHNETRGLRREK